MSGHLSYLYDELYEGSMTYLYDELYEGSMAYLYDERPLVSACLIAYEHRPLRHGRHLDVILVQVFVRQVLLQQLQDL